MNRYQLPLATLLSLLTAMVSVIASADEPSAAYIFPAGGQRGTTVEVRVGGHYLHESPDWEVLGTGVSIASPLRRAERTIWFEGPLIPTPDSQRQENYPSDHLGALAIESDARLGWRRWRVATSQGAARTLPFVVGDLPEIVEVETDGEPIPVRVQLPVTINGRIFPREDIDIWTFEARAGETYSCQVLAARIGSPLDSRLVVFDPHGEQVAESVDAVGNDSRLHFLAQHDGLYQVQIHDTDFGGLQHYVYRLTITPGPFIEHVYPLGGRRGESVHIELVGQNLPQSPLTIAIPSSSEESASTDAAAAPATVAWQWQDQQAISNPVWLDVSDLPELLEQEPNDTADTALDFSGSAVLNGRIQSPGDVDRWRFSAGNGERIEFEARAAQLGSPLHAVLAIEDAEGNVLARADEPRAGQADVTLTFSAPAEGTYQLIVSERFAQRGDRRFGYRIQVRRGAEVKPSFTLNLPTDALIVKRGGEAKLKFTVERHDGFTGPIHVRVEGLPAGVTADQVEVVGNKSDGALSFKASETAQISRHRLEVRGQAEIDGTLIESSARFASLAPADVPVDHLLLAVALPTPFKVVGDFETKYAARGSTYVRRFTIDRGGYEGPLTVRLAERQARHLQGVTGPTIAVPPGISEFEYPIHLPPWMEIGRTSRTCVMAVGQIADDSGTVHTVSDTSHEQNDQIIVLVDPGQLAVRLERTSILATPGRSVTLPVTIGRGREIEGPVRLELVCPDHIHGLTAQPLDLPVGEIQASLDLVFAEASLGPFNQPLIIRATASRDGLRYTAEARLEIVLPRDAQHAGYRLPN